MTILLLLLTAFQLNASGYTHMGFAERQKLVSHPLAKEICSICEEKETNLCVAADLETLDEVITLIDQIGPKIAVLKMHVDMTSDFSEDKIATLQSLAAREHFILFEDRKFNDIGKTVKAQYIGGLYKIANWASLSNLMTVSGPGILDALKEGIQEVPEAKNNAFLLLAEMSSKGSKFPLFVDQVYQEAKNYSDVVIGFIAQRSFGDPSFLTFTPGINAVQKGDKLGQQYNTPEVAINKGADIIIVGTGICSALDPVQAAEDYRQAGWQAHLHAITNQVSYEEVFQ